jgi:hypothetical protein
MATLFVAFNHLDRAQAHKTIADDEDELEIAHHGG